MSLVFYVYKLIYIKIRDQNKQLIFIIFQLILPCFIKLNNYYWFYIMSLILNLS